MLSRHLAELYGVETRALVQAVKRNAERFPDDFMFQLTAAELAGLKSQIVISNGRGGRRCASPCAADSRRDRSDLRGPNFNADATRPRLGTWNLEPETTSS